jgi:hypothetical protein
MRVRKLANDGLKIFDDIPHYAKKCILAEFETIL